MAASASYPSESLRPVFEKIKIGDLPRTAKGKVEVLRSDMTVRDAVQTLHDKGILSAPVVDVTKADSASWKEKYLGIVDVVRLVVVMQEALFREDSGIPEEDEAALAAPDTKAPLHFHPLTSSFGERPLSDLTEGEHGWLPFMPIEEDATLMDAIVLLGTFKLKRLPVISAGANGDLVNIITQSSIVDMLSKSLDQLTPVASKTLEELGLAEPCPVMSVRATQPVSAAFALIAKHGVSAVPVLGVDGEMVGNISARHGYFVITARNKLHVLSMKTSQFLAWSSEKECSWNIKNTAIMCKASDTLGSVITRLAVARIHRIYLCDHERRPYRVLALCDILMQFGASPSQQGCSLL